jgi:hypothetical protein
VREEYDFSRRARGKYARRSAQGTNVVVLDADVAKKFPNSKSVNASLRKLIRREVSSAGDKAASAAKAAKKPSVSSPSPRTSASQSRTLSRATSSRQANIIVDEWSGAEKM